MIKKRRGEDEDDDSPSCLVGRKKSRDIAKAGFVSLKTFDIPLISTISNSPCESIYLKPGHLYSIGRNSRLCELVFQDPRVSKLHCQLFFDPLLRKIFILDGKLLFPTIAFDKVRASLNGVFVNGVRIGKGKVAELSAGDEVLLVCGNASLCNLGIQIGFFIERIVFTEEVVKLPGFNKFALEGQKLIGTKPLDRANGRSPDCAFSISECGGLSARTNVLSSQCRRILNSDDPISCIRGCAIFPGFVQVKSNILECSVGGKQEVTRNAHVFGKEPPTRESSHTDRNMKTTRAGMVGLSSITVPREELGVLEVTHVPLNGCVHDNRLFSRENVGVHFENASAGYKPKVLLLNSVGKENAHHPDGAVEKNSCGSSCSPPGKKFYLNRLKFVDHNLPAQRPVISLPELLHPVESLSRIFIATFTSDILWFLSYCRIPCHLPVTIACHDTERCWSSSPDKRTSVPYSDYPNLVVVYPPFPEAVAFGKDRKKKGIACHHPKLFVLLRDDNIRVIITSANLVEKQWSSVTNTIWWQDFPRTSAPNYSSLFTQISGGETDQDLKSDFVAQLAGFMASLLIDVPNQAHWVVELTKYDFGGAVGHLVVSIPGIHFYRTPYVSESTHFLLANQCASWPSGSKFGSVEASVVGLSHLFHTTADSNGVQLKKLAAYLWKCCQNAYEVSEIVLRRNMNIPADMNAVSVLVPNPDEFSEGDCIQLGFLPRNIAKWLSPLWDCGFFRFSGYIHPKDTLAAALEGNGKKVQLILYVSQGPSFSDISRMMQPEHVSALCSLIASIKRCAGLQRLQEVLGQYKWPELLETDFLYGSSSIGSSINAQFLAAFSAAAGKRSLQFAESEESDPEWGCWNASQESRSPSIKIIFPTIERVKNSCCGILPSKRILCFPERTWQRLRSVDIFHDAIPHPHDRVGHPMHVKVARRRFQLKTDASSSFGWVYSGSHNFSAAAWGRPVSNPFGIKPNGNGKPNSSLGLTLHICNYELGIIFVFPPPGIKGSINHSSTNLDDVVLPFVVPAPKYEPRDGPATKHSMWEALAELTEQASENFATTGEKTEEEIPDEEEEVVEATDYVVEEEKEEEKVYAEILWSQVDSSQSC